jgi:hypothetical protein
MELLPMTMREAAELQRCEKVIERGQKAFMEVGSALAKIKEDRLYRREYDTFQDYCQQRWGWDRRHAYRLIDAAKVGENVSNWSQTPPRSEAVARELSRLPVNEQGPALAEARKRANGEPTAAQVREVVNEHLAEKAAEDESEQDEGEVEVEVVDNEEDIVDDGQEGEDDSAPQRSLVKEAIALAKQWCKDTGNNSESAAAYLRVAADELCGD